VAPRSWFPPSDIVSSGFAAVGWTIGCFAQKERCAQSGATSAGIAAIRTENRNERPLLWQAVTPNRARI
jgi:hypothetical protein